MHACIHPSIHPTNQPTKTHTPHKHRTVVLEDKEARRHGRRCLRGRLRPRVPHVHLRRRPRQGLQLGPAPVGVLHDGVAHLFWCWVGGWRTWAVRWWVEKKEKTDFDGMNGWMDGCTHLDDELGGARVGLEEEVEGPADAGVEVLRLARLLVGVGPLEEAPGDDRGRVRVRPAELDEVPGCVWGS